MRSRKNRKLNTGINYGNLTNEMDMRKITVEIPDQLLEKAQEATGTGVTQTVRASLELMAASRADAQLRSMRGKVRFSLTAAELKTDS